MEKFLIFTIVGLTVAATYAIFASGLVLTYTTTGIFNFAQGAIGMLAAFAYWQVHVDWGWPTPAAVALVVLVAAPLFGLALERVVMRGLGGTTEATKLVVSISLLVAMIGLANLVWEPGQSRRLQRFFEGDSIDLGPTTITYHQGITILTAVVVAVGLRFLLYRTRIGVSMRANVDDPTLVLLNAARPNRIAQISWAVGSALAAVGGILIASVVSLESASLSLLIVSAYAAAIFGRLRSLPLAFVGAVVIGLTEGYLQGYLPGENQYTASFRAAAPAIILFLILLVLPNPRLSTRTNLREFFPAPSPSGVAFLAVGVLVVATVMVTTLGTSDLISYGQIFPLAIVALSLVPLVGYAGQISLAQLSFAGIGAIAAAHHGAGGSPLGLVLAVAFAAIVGGLVALPVLRLSGIYLALATAAFAVVLDRWIFSLPDFDLGPVHISLFGLGSKQIDPLQVFGYTFDSPGSQLMLSAVAFALVAILVAGLRRSRLGLQLVAMRDSEAACATFGLNLKWPRLGVFMLSAGIAGLGGALYGMQLGTVGSNRFAFVTGLPLFMMVVVGGAGLVGAGLFAGVALYGLIPLTAGLGALIAKVNTVTPGLTGVGLGRNPSGVLPVMQAQVHPLRHDGAALGAMGVAMAGAYALRQADVLTNWAFVIAIAGIFVAALAFASARARAREDVPDTVVPALDDLDWVGITVPWTPEHLAHLDTALALEDVVGDHPPPVGAAASRAATVSAVRVVDLASVVEEEVDVVRP